MNNYAFHQIKIKSSFYSRYYAEACNELRGPSPRLSAWATQLRRNVAAVASRWRHCADLTGPGIEPQTSRTESVRLTTELTAIDSLNYYSPINENDTRQAEWDLLAPVQKLAPPEPPNRGGLAQKGGPVNSQYVVLFTQRMIKVP